MLMGIRRKWTMFCVNYLFQGTNDRYWERKRKLLNAIGHEIGEGTKVVGPVRLYGKLHTGKNVWLGTNFTIHGLGNVYLGSNCDIAPDVTCLTGSHEIGTHERRAGQGVTQDIVIGDGCWICARSTLVGSCHVGNGSIIAAGAVVNAEIDSNSIAGGIPAKVIRKLESE